MPTWKFSGFGSSLLSFLISTVTPIGYAAAQGVGTVGAVNKDATGAAPGHSAKTLEIGQSVVQKERIQTDVNGTAHIMFNDRSALNVGRNSSIVIDSFVYDASAGAGRQIVTLAQGAARFVGGQISHSSETTIKTPAASIGVRGGNVTVIRERSGGTVVMVHNGSATVTTSSGIQTLRTGFQLIIQSGGPLGEPTRIGLDRLRDATRQLASSGRQTGGAQKPPTSKDALRHAIGSKRAPAQAPSFDLPAAGDDIVRGSRRPIPVPQPRERPYVP
jgi:hypothetical protein